MTMHTLVTNHWKKALVGLAIFGAGAVAGPIAGKAVGVLLPKALEHVKDAPISALKAHESPFSKTAITHEPKEVVIRFTLAEREALRKGLGPEWTPTGKMFCTTEAR
jgi:hypothetical protein